MLPERHWETEPLLRLVAGVCFVVAVGMLAASSLLPQAAAGTIEGKFYLLVTSSVVLHGGTLLLVAAFLRAHAVGWCDGFGIQRRTLARAVGFALAGVILALPVAGGLQWLASRGLAGLQRELVAHEITAVDVQPQTQQLVQTLKQTETLEQRIFFALVAIVFAPLVEEVGFRGILYAAIKQRGYPRLALWGTSLVFGLIHGNLATIVPLTFLGLVFVFLYERTGNLLAPILAHSLFNAANYFALVFQRELQQLLKLSP